MSGRAAIDRIGLAGWLAVLLGLAAYVGAGVWLMEAVAWPDMCRPGGRNLAYMISSLSCSPGLLKLGWAGLGLFAWLWSMPVAILWMVAQRLLKRPVSNPISSPNPSE